MSILTTPTQIFFNQTFNFYELLPTSEKSDYFFIRDRVDLKTLNLIDQEQFGPYLKNQTFP